MCGHYLVLCVLVLLVKLSDCQTVTCNRSDGLSCQIDLSNEHAFCWLYCEPLDECSMDCDMSGFQCAENITSDTLVQYCCRESYCNIINRVIPSSIVPSSIAPSSSSLPSSQSIPSSLTSSSQPITPSPSVGSSQDNSSSNDNHLIVIAVCVVTVVLVTTIVASLAIINWLRWKRQNSMLKSIRNLVHHDRAITEDSIMDMTSGSGSGVPRMVKRTIAKQIELGEVIGSGRYGQVYVGDYRDDLVAVKIFSTVDEESWKREKEIYNIVLIRHDNILGYIAADMISNNGVTELWLITQYHPLGSLYDFLSVPDTVLTPARMISLALSICNGLLHLHTEFSGVQSKPAIAHRDLKSKNILVKTNYTCCIADFGLAVYMDVETRKINLPSTYKNGTVRYLAPEILNNTIDLNIFDSFFNVDIYCLGLVLWEVGLRTAIRNEVDEYQVPYYNMVPHDPSFEEMKKVVGVDGQRPPIPQRWASCDVLRAVEELICECWYQDGNARLTAARVKRRLKKVAQDLKIDQI